MDWLEVRCILDKVNFLLEKRLIDSGVRQKQMFFAHLIFRTINVLLLLTPCVCCLRSYQRTTEHLCCDVCLAFLFFLFFRRGRNDGAGLACEYVLVGSVNHSLTVADVSAGLFDKSDRFLDLVFTSFIYCIGIIGYAHIVMFGRLIV